MIEKIQIENNLITEINQYLKNHNLGQRGRFDGSKRNQLVGLIGEITVYKYLLKSEYQFKSGYDNGRDFIYHNQRIDIKTMERTVDVRRGFVHNFLALQEKLCSDVLIFCSYNSNKTILEICGWIFKNELKTKANFYTKGTPRKRQDGTGFILKEDLYEIPHERLNPIQSL